MIKVYYACIDKVNTEPGAYPVSRERQEKALRCRLAEDRKRSLGAALLLQAGLLQTIPDFLPPAELETGPGGKPLLSGYHSREGRWKPLAPSLECSLSHSGRYAACVLSDAPVGIDLESVCRPVPPAVWRKFHPLEQEWIGAAGDPEKAAVSLWVLKESYLKALGTGLREALSAFCVREEERTEKGQERFCVWRGKEKQPCELRLLREPEGYVMAVCRLGGIEPAEVTGNRIELT